MRHTCAEGEPVVEDHQRLHAIMQHVLQLSVVMLLMVRGCGWLIPMVHHRVFEQDGGRVVCDTLSLEFLRGATLEFEDTLMRAAFTVGREGWHCAVMCGCGVTMWIPGTPECEPGPLTGIAGLGVRCPFAPADETKGPTGVLSL